MLVHLEALKRYQLALVLLAHQQLVLTTPMEELRIKVVHQHLVVLLGQMAEINLEEEAPLVVALVVVDNHLYFLLQAQRLVLVVLVQLLLQLQEQIIQFHILILHLEAVAEVVRQQQVLLWLAVALAVVIFLHLHLVVL